ncbi:glycine cleavage system protein T [Rhizobiaceae bacterium]|nr:glycine cleavage system protein T [Rhizobiaceae bacterium]
MPQITPSVRVRPSPFYEAALADGMTTASVYNHMIMPTGYGDPEAEYWRLIEGVSQWDVGVERQVQLKGPDAARLAQILCTRDLSKCAVGQGKYVAICDHDGTILNDPIILKLADDTFWLSIADSDMRLWAKAVAAERGLDVEVTEPDVSPMAIQGPKAADVVAKVCGEWVRELKYFWFREAEIEGIPVAVQRSGWSKQGGFEIYLRDGTQGMRLWEIFKQAGEPFGIGPGAPATAERFESGLVSAGADTDDRTNPYEINMGRYIDLHVPDDTIGIQALRKIAETGPTRQLLGVLFDAGRVEASVPRLDVITHQGKVIGHLTNVIWSPRLQRSIGYAMVSRSVTAGERIAVERSDGPAGGTLATLPFL